MDLRGEQGHLQRTAGEVHAERCRQGSFEVTGEGCPFFFNMVLMLPILITMSLGLVISFVLTVHFILHIYRRIYIYIHIYIYTYVYIHIKILQYILFSGHVPEFSWMMRDVLPC